MVDEVIEFLKTAIGNQYREYVESRLVTGNVGKDGYEKAVGILEALKATQSNLDVWGSEFKKLKGD